jgi:hypothetical protein
MPTTLSLKKQVLIRDRQIFDIIEKFGRARS